MKNNNKKPGGRPGLRPLYIYILGLAGMILFSGPDMVFAGAETEIQQPTGGVSGRITDGNGMPMIGVTIQVQGKSGGSISNADGQYTISNAGSEDILVFSFLGMETITEPIAGRAVVNVVMEEKTDSLEEVTVVAFARQKKESVIGSISTVRVSDLNTPSSNLTTSLAGRMSGMIAYQRSGEPGRDNAEFFIRGVTTFGYKKDPLILVDNMEMSSSDLARLQPDDIASFSIMKDATATSLYGARGANGVILITTKEGREGKAKVSVRFENSFSTPTQMVKLADPITYMQLNNEAVATRDPLGITPYPESKIAATRDPNRNIYMYPAVNWLDEMFKQYAVNQRLNMNISGGGQVVRYYIAATFNKDSGLMRNEGQNNFNSNIDLKQYSIRTNFNVNVTKSTEAIVRFQGDFDDYRGPRDAGNILFDYALHASPVDYPKVYAPDQQHQSVTHPLYGNMEGIYINPYAIMSSGYKDYRRNNILAQLEVRQDFDFITPGLKARAMYSTTRYSYFDVSRYYNPFYYNIGYYDRDLDQYYLSALNEDSGTEYLNYNEGQKDVVAKNYIEAAVDYSRTFGRHAVSGLLVYTRNDELRGNAGSVIKSLAYRNQGLSGRFTYGYDSRYMLELNFGYNGSERFAKHERYGFFPAAGAAWLVSNEDFWEPVSPVISKLKFKGTYGLVGNDAIGDENDRFFYLSDLNMDASGRGQTFGTNWGNYKSGIAFNRYPNSAITWEVAYKTNVGAEIGLFNKVEVQVEYFTEKRKKILMDRSYIPTSMGLEASVRANVGQAKSRGVDMSVDYSHYLSPELWISARGNFTYATSEFTVADEPNYSAAGIPWRSRVGYSLNQHWGLIAERLFIDEADIANSPTQTFGDYMPGDIKYKDINKDGIIDDNDLVAIGFPDSPEIVYGLGLSMGYKNFDFSCFFQGLARESFFIDAQQVSPFNNPPITTGGIAGYPRKTALFKAFADDHWSEYNRDLYAMWPRLSTDAYSSENNYQKSTWWMRDGSFLRLKSVEIGYTLPTDLTRKIGVSSLRVYLSGTNLLTFSKFDLWDPEMGGWGIGYPLQKVYNVGIQVNF